MKKRSALKKRNAATALLAAIVGSSNDAIIGKDPRGVITSWNPGAERLFGYTAGEMIGRPIAQLIPPERRREQDYILGRVALGERVEHFETVRIAKGGRAIDVSVTISPIRDAAGIVVGSSKVARDITERKQTQEALEAAHLRLQAASARLHETWEAERQSVAHELHDEIGQALAAIKMNVHLVQSRTAAPQLAECLRIADAVLQRVRALSVDLRPPQLSELGLEAAVRAYVERCTRESGFDIDFRANLGAARFQPHFEVACFRVIQEALQTAIHHAARRLWIELVQRDGELNLTVADDGTGFDMAERMKAAAGEPVGLAAMLERVRLAQGHIDIASSPELGTEIRVTWQIASRAAAA